MKRFWLTLALVPVLAAQTTPAAGEAEERALNEALAEAGSSPVEFIRALEKHLEKYPNTTRRKDLERALVKAAIETRDEKRIILYGERVLAREPDDPQVLDRVTRALLTTDARDPSERAYKYAKHYEQVVTGMRGQSPPGRAGSAEWVEELDRGLGRALVLEARAAGNLGRMDEAVALARRSYDTYPNAESAREIGRWLARSGKEQDALAHIADAFSIPDARQTDAERAKDRARLGELYRKLKGTEIGLGDLMLEAYDRTTGLLAARRLRMRDADPNSQAASITEFKLTGLDASKLDLSSLKGKTLVFDFWATWCGPCRAQHPLIEQVKEKFQDSSDVMFLSINTDEDKDVVQPFIKENGWTQKVWFEDGLARLLQISSIPTTIIVNRKGEVVSRLAGFVPDRFVQMLAERIQEARGRKEIGDSR